MKNSLSWSFEEKKLLQKVFRRERESSIGIPFITTSLAYKGIERLLIKMYNLLPRKERNFPHKFMNFKFSAHFSVLFHAEIKLKSFRFLRSEARDGQSEQRVE